MATFAYRCTATTCPSTAQSDPGFDATFPIGTAPATLACPTCGTDAVRVFTPPRLALTPRGLTAALDAAQRWRVEPEVVAGPPPRTGSTRRANRQVEPQVNPALARLPRP